VAVAFAGFAFLPLCGALVSVFFLPAHTVSMEQVPTALCYPPHNPIDCPLL